MEKMRVLAIETSCDDTCISVGEGQQLEGKNQGFGNFKILASVVSSQIEVHKIWGGVYPSLAKREHQKNLVLVLEEALKKSRMLKESSKFEIRSSRLQFKARSLRKILERELGLFENLKEFLEKYQKPKIDLIAVTIGPGLEPCLWVGVNFAKALGYCWNLPIIPVNHIEAHIFANFLNDNLSIINNKGLFPSICLVVSGGHTQLILMKGFGKYKILGETRDDAAGEAFDKIARILGLPYPGGPAIAAEAKKLSMINPSTNSGQVGRLSIKLPRPMIYSKDYDFSFSGLKTAVLYDFKKRSKIVRESKKYIQEMAFEAQQAIIDVLVKKTIKAAKEFKAKSIILGGGVAANDKLRSQFKKEISLLKEEVQMLVPPKKLCTDNADMIALTAYYHWKKNGKIKQWRELKACPNLRLS
jgi:N6-L-threonylcarbamoyladenine synthase